MPALETAIDPGAWRNFTRKNESRSIIGEGKQFFCALPRLFTSVFF
jgi:hypothetical protein